MSLRLEMLQVARLAPSLLGGEASPLVHGFLLRKQNPDGGFQDREGESDLYYTSFAIDALTALQEALPEKTLIPFLERKLSKPDDLDFVHLCCLARCLSALPSMTGAFSLNSLFSRIENLYRSQDGGYNQSPHSRVVPLMPAFLPGAPTQTTA